MTEVAKIETFAEIESNGSISYVCRAKVSGSIVEGRGDNIDFAQRRFYSALRSHVNPRSWDTSEPLPLTHTHEVPGHA